MSSPAAAVPSSASAWVEATRPKTLAAALAPSAVGAAAASAAGVLVVWRAVTVVVLALALQTAVNFANDFFDGVGGVDTADRAGPRRMVASGLIAPASMRRATVVASAVAVAAAAVLTAVAGWTVAVLSAASLAAVWGYSGGPRPYASAGLGEVMVFVFFGPVATVLSGFVHAGRVLPVTAAASVPVGLLAVVILLANNLRDIPTDEAAGKRTLAVRLGEHRTRRLYVAVLAGAFAALVPVVLTAGSGWPLVALATVPLAVQAGRTGWTAPVGPALVVALEQTGRLLLLFGLMLACGVALS